jgi:NTE family protein
MQKLQTPTPSILRLIAASLLLALLAGCAPFNYLATDAPVAQTTPPLLQPRPRIAIVLGSGGPRGYAHVGILKVLEEAGIVPDLVVGSSVGALIGSFWASGMSAVDIEREAMAGGPLTLFDLSPFADRGWIHGQRLQDYVNRGLKDKTMEALPRPLIVVATARDSKAPVFLTSGNTGVAVRASSAVPGVISPVGISGVEYEDADVSLPVAVSAARAAGAQFVIAVDVSAYAGSAPPGTDKAWLDRDVKRRSLIDPEVAQADFLIHPDLGYSASPRQSYFEHARKVGELTARQLLPELTAKLKMAQFAMR